MDTTDTTSLFEFIEKCNCEPTRCVDRLFQLAQEEVKVYPVDDSLDKLSAVAARGMVFDRQCSDAVLKLAICIERCKTQ